MEIGAFLCDYMYDMEKYGFKDVYDAAKIGVEHGITAIDLPCPYLLRGEFVPETLSENLKKCGAHITSAHHAVRCDYTSSESVDKGVQEMKAAMRLAKRAGAPNFMIVFCPVDEEDYSIKEQFKAQVRRVMPELVSYAKELGLTPTIEDYSTLLYPYSTFDDIGWLLTNNPDLMFNYDSGNFGLSLIDELEGAKLFANRTVHIHLKDLVKSDKEGLFLREGTYYDSVALGKGYLKNEEALKVMKNAGYDSAVIIEVCPPKDDMFAEVLESAKYLKELFDRI